MLGLPLFCWLSPAQETSTRFFRFCAGGLRAIEYAPFCPNVAITPNIAGFAPRAIGFYIHDTGINIIAAVIVIATIVFLAIVIVVVIFTQHNTMCRCFRI